jgi:hypothetical protein
LNVMAFVGYMQVLGAVSSLRLPCPERAFSGACAPRGLSFRRMRILQQGASRVVVEGIP